MNILIITAFFPPHNSVGSFRPYSWARWWSRFGHQVSVLTTEKHVSVSNSPMPIDSFRLIEISIPGLNCFWRFRHTESPISISSSDVKGLSFPPWELYRIRNALSCLQQKYGIFYAIRYPDIHDLWVSRAIRWAKKQKWDAVVTTGGPYSVHRAGLYLKKHGMVHKWVLDWRDLWTDNHIFPGLPLFRHWEKHLERKFHEEADVITTVSGPLSRIIRGKTDSPVFTIYNGFDPEDSLSINPDPIFPNSEQLHIVYTGTLYPGKQDPSPLFHAIRKMTKAGKVTTEKLKVIFAGRCEESRLIANRIGVSGFCEYVGRVPRTEALRMQRDSDVLLFLEFDAPSVEGILTGKLFEYLWAGPPIMAIGISKTSGAGRLITATGTGVVCGTDTEKIESFLRTCLSVSGRDKQRWKRNEKLIFEYTREVQARKMLDLLKR